MAEEDGAMKVVVLGGGGVGKSALVVRLVSGNFLVDYDPTIEDNFSKVLNVDGVSVPLSILDTAGQDEFTEFRSQYYREGKGFLIVYAVDSEASFAEVATFQEQIQRVKEEDNIPIVLVGNKCDLPDEMREVTQEEGQALADKWHCSFMETSAKQQINNEECFVELVRQIHRAEEHRRSVVEAQGGGARKRLKCLIL